MSTTTDEAAEETRELLWLFSLSQITTGVVLVCALQLQALLPRLNDFRRLLKRQEAFGAVCCDYGDVFLCEFYPRPGLCVVSDETDVAVVGCL